MPSPVVDLSHWNPTPDWAKLKAGGVVGVIHKATESTGYVDDQLFSRAKAALAAGLKWSTYHFLRPGSMQAQMQHYLSTINPVPGERVCLDHEDAGVSLANLEQAVKLLQADPRKLQVTIYSGHVIKDQLGSKRSEVLASTSLWIAHYTTAAQPTWPSGTWPSWSLWQWTDKEKVPGISQPVDGDRWNGTPEALLEWFGPAGAEPAPSPPPPPPPSPELEPIVMTVPAGQRLIVNGKEIELA